jgi:predicted esterase
LPAIPFIYYVPGRHETCDEHAGAVLSRLGLRHYGRDVTDEFLRHPFSRQIEIITSDIRDHINENALIIGRSFGGYLILHTVCEIGAYPGRILLFNPMLGRYINKKQMCGIIPPRADLLFSLAISGEFPEIRSLTIAAGEHDMQCPPDAAGNFIAALGSNNARLIVMPGQGHNPNEAELNRIIMEHINLY